MVPVSGISTPHGSRVPARVPVFRTSTPQVPWHLHGSWYPGSRAPAQSRTRRVQGTRKPPGHPPVLGHPHGPGIQVSGHPQATRAAARSRTRRVQGTRKPPGQRATRAPARSRAPGSRAPGSRAPARGAPTIYDGTSLRSSHHRPRTDTGTSAARSRI